MTKKATKSKPRKTAAKLLTLEEAAAIDFEPWQKYQNLNVSALKVDDGRFHWHERRSSAPSRSTAADGLAAGGDDLCAGRCLHGETAAPPPAAWTTPRRGCRVPACARSCEFAFSPSTLYTACAATGGGGSASVTYSGSSICVDGIGLGIVAVEVSLGELRIRRRRYAEGERTTVAGRDSLRHVVHEQLGLPARRNVERQAASDPAEACCRCAAWPAAETTSLP